MRITQRAVALNSLRGLNSNLAAVNKLQNQLTSGKTISKPSDDPTGTNTSMITRQAQAGERPAGPQHLRRPDVPGRHRLGAAEHARPGRGGSGTSTVQALNTGALVAGVETRRSRPRSTASGRACSARPTRSSRAGRIFGGVTSGSQAYDPTTGAYVGVGGANGIAVQPVTRRVSDVEAIRVDITGPEAFGDPASGKDLFAVVASIAAHVGDPTALTTDLTDLDNVHQRDDDGRGRRRHPGGADGRRRRRVNSAQALDPADEAERHRGRRPAEDDHGPADAADRLPGRAVGDGQVAAADPPGLPAVTCAAPTRSASVRVGPRARPHAAARPASPVAVGLTLTEPLPGFPRYRDYVLVPADAAGLLYWLQSVAPDGPRFLAVPAAAFFPDYAPALPARPSAANSGSTDAARGAAVLPGHRARRRRRRRDGEPARAARGQPRRRTGPVRSC